MKSFSAVARGVAQKVFGEHGLESNVRFLLRSFTKFVESTGGTTEKLKNERGQMMFEDEAVPILQLILTQLAQKKGFAYDFMKKKVDLASLNDTHALIQQLLDAMAEDGLTDAEAQAIVDWLDCVFQFSFRVTLENCHRIVDGVAMNLAMDYPYDYTMERMNEFHHLMKQIFTNVVVKTIMNIGELGEVLKEARESGQLDFSADLFRDAPILHSDFVRRDNNVLAYLRQYPEIRKHIEKRVGCNIETLWGTSKNAE